MAAFIQDRLGPVDVGSYGTLQPFADLLKMIQKEDIVPANANSILFKLSPLFIFIVVFAGFAFVPIAPGISPMVSGVGIYFCLTIISLDVIGLLMAGWSTDNKFALLGAMRSVAQIISYEIPVGITVLTVIVVAGSMDLVQISHNQTIWSDRTSWLFGLSSLQVDITHWGGFFKWNIMQSPLMFVVYLLFYVATLAECNRAPFDLPEAESELVSGYHAEYSGIRFGIFFLAEYAMMILVSLLGAVLFFGAWGSPFPDWGNFRLGTWTSGEIGSWTGIVWGIFWITLKTILPCLIMIWIRWTFPRLRTDQLMYLCWKVLIPASLICFLLISAQKILVW